MSDIVPRAPWRWVPSPNHGGTRARTLGVVIHSTRGGQATLEAEYQATVRYGAAPNASDFGPHFVVGPAEVTRMIHDDVICWCQTVDNDDFLGIEVAQPTPTTPYTDFQYRATADLVSQLLLKYSLPVVYLGKQYTPQVERRGVLGHEDTRAGWERGKTDPGDLWDWPHFMRLVEEAGMTAAERAGLNECAAHVWRANQALDQEIANLERVTGPTPLTEELHRLRAEYHQWGVHEVKEIAGLN